MNQIWPIGTEIWFRTDGRNGRTDGRSQNYIPPTSSGDNKEHKGVICNMTRVILPKALVLHQYDIKNLTFSVDKSVYLEFWLTGIIASAHSPCPLCNTLILSTSLQICTRSPTANCGAADVLGVAPLVLVSLVAELALLGVLTLVSTAGLNVHLKTNTVNLCKTATQK